MEGTYKINLIPNDLSVEETILQIADALDNLNGIVDDVFTRISTKINKNMNKTMELQTRIVTSKTKVDKLAGMQKAIKVFSSAKYPASIVHEHYQSIFDKNTYHYEPKRVTLSGKSKRPSNEKGIQEKLHFFHVKVAEPKSTRHKQENQLKTVIENVSSVDELLIFNTDESPYIGLPSKQEAYVPRAVTDVKKTVLDEAPPSIMKGNVLAREIDEYMYAPGMGMVPELDMPLDLPHLPGVAGDVQYSFSDDGTIAPSAVTSPVAPTVPLPELPDVSVLPDVKPDVPEVVEDVVGKVPDVPDAPPAPPMPVSIPPPPPPPPMDFVTPVKTRREEIPAPPSGGDAHANLMAAIRQAGGAGRAKLKAADNISEKGATSSIPKPGGDLMADLHAKLSMRRRGISGAERSSGGTVLHTLASIIPEPEEQSDPQQSSSDEDWK
ncbi:WASH complex subunit 1 isoform X1 [Pieris brassicae]|uniref:WH2 domain-containing protein n=1 Tax=Pieris brassicae TaxID=7116 RepID=A0A9P0T5H9_PIEBR|nr:WASH complex subunit 1 isoform X1 [Pieris brassicae]CAH3997687.1 unnamed protein product [Pieris brassicae]